LTVSSQNVIITMMTIWTPDLAGHRPKYLELADAIATDIASGRLSPGTRLPTHRTLAQRLGVTIGTVSRGYAEAQRRGLIRGEVGRGTYVLGLPDEPDRSSVRSAREPESGVVELARLNGALGGAAENLERAVAEYGRVLSARNMLTYEPARGARRHREAGAFWIRASGLAEARAEDVVVTSGAQHAILLAMASVANPGDVVLTASLTYPGMIAAARFLHLRLAGVTIDEGGLVPEAFEEACRENHPKALYCVPTLHNPTATVMSEDRRREIAAIARTHDVTLVEDDLFAFLMPQPPTPLVHYSWPSGIYLTSLSKSILPGLRVGYVRASGEVLQRIAAGVVATTWMPTTPTVELATTLIENNTAEQLGVWKRRQVARRQRLARGILGDHVVRGSSEHAMHLWVEVPEPWRANAFVAEAYARGVAVNRPDEFAVGRRHAVPQAIRVCIAGMEDEETLRRALRILHDLLENPPPPAPVLT